MGFCDWQLTVRDHCMHDIHYLIITALPVEARRRHRQDLSPTTSTGSVPTVFATCLSPGRMAQYRRAIVWGLWVGWVGTPVVCYGWEINLVNHLRLATAYADHETGAW